MFIYFLFSSIEADGEEEDNERVSSDPKVVEKVRAKAAQLPIPPESPVIGGIVRLF